MCRPISFSSLVVGMLLTAGCATTPTTVNTAWKQPSLGPISFQKVAIVVLNSTPAERRAQEDELVSHVKKTTAIASYAFITDAELTDQQTAKQKIRDGGFDGALVIRMIDASKQISYVPNGTSQWEDSWDDSRKHGPGYYISDTVVRAQISLYTVADGKLLWAGNCNSTNPANAQDFARQLADAGAARLRAEGLLP